MRIGPPHKEDRLLEVSLSQFIDSLPPHKRYLNTKRHQYTPKAVPLVAFHCTSKLAISGKKDKSLLVADTEGHYIPNLHSLSKPRPSPTAFPTPTPPTHPLPGRRTPTAFPTPRPTPDSLSTPSPPARQPFRALRDQSFSKPHIPFRHWFSGAGRGPAVCARQGAWPLAVFQSQRYINHRGRNLWSSAELNLPLSVRRALRRR